MDSSKPAVIALNHPTAFIDPCIMGTIGCGLNTYYLLRGDMFASGLFRQLLALIHCIPIYRFRDGFEQMKKNADTLAYVQRLLSQKVKLVVLVEGRVKQEWRLAPVQKGAARMAFEAYFERGQKDLTIIPTGMNYLDPNRLRSDLFVQIDAPIQISDYEAVYHENPRKAVRQLTKDIEQRMRALIWHVEEEEDDRMAEQYLTLLHAKAAIKEATGLRSTRDLNQNYHREVDRMNTLDATEKQAFKTKLNTLYAMLDDFGLRANKIYESQNGWGILEVIILFALPILVPFLGICALPWYIGHLVSKSKIKQREFFGPVRFGIAKGMYLLVILISIPFSLLVWSLGPLVLALLFPALSRLMAAYFDQLIGIVEKWKWTLLDQKEKEEVKQALNLIVK